MTIRRGIRTGRARCAGVASGCVRRVRPGRGTARTDALVDFAAGMVVLRVPPQAPRVAVRLAASFGLALVRLLVSMRQHVSVPAKISKFVQRISLRRGGEGNAILDPSRFGVYRIHSF